MKASRFQHKKDDHRVQCDLCPQGCVVGENKTGLCMVRRVKDGTLRAEGYGLLSSMNVDPIEKKPLYHFRPGSSILSIGGWGCNLKCVFCQNWAISQETFDGGKRYSPEDVVSRGSTQGSIGIAYTYNEPLINYEFVRECAGLARSAGLKNVLVTNGFVNREPAAELLPLVDALNIDIKSMNNAFYKRYCRGSLAPVLDFSVQAAKTGCHVEITNLLIPSLNDNEDDILSLARWVSNSLGKDTPLHLSAYHPQYKLRIPSTPVELLERAYDICRRELFHVYLGNVLTKTGQQTKCPHCANTLIERRGYVTRVTGITNGVCAGCGKSAGAIS